MAYLLTVNVPDIETFEAYDYGNGTVLDAVPYTLGSSSGLEVTVRYEDDQKYYAEYQMARFHSGLYGARLSIID